jgi:hypothetical protein
VDKEADSESLVVVMLPDGALDILPLSIMRGETE